MASDQILDLTRRWADAERRSDAKALDLLLTNDFLGVGPRGFVLDRAQWLNRFSTGDLRIDDFAVEDVTVREYGDSAVAVGIVKQKASYQGQDSSGRFRVTEVAVRRNGGWQLSTVQYSGPIPDMPQARP